MSHKPGVCCCCSPFSMCPSKEAGVTTLKCRGGRAFLGLGKRQIRIRMRSQEQADRHHFYNRVKSSPSFSGPRSGTGDAKTPEDEIQSMLTLSLRVPDRDHSRPTAYSHVRKKVTKWLVRVA